MNAPLFAAWVSGRLDIIQWEWHSNSHFIYIEHFCRSVASRVVLITQKQLHFKPALVSIYVFGRFLF